MRATLSVALLALCLGAPAPARPQVSVRIGTPGVGIALDVPTYPRLVRVPGYPVYYAPSVNGNLFFYDGIYWVLAGDGWYESSWYDGPWTPVPPEAVPLFVLRIPIRYYRAPPPWFHGWVPDRPPRWGEHWGPDWERHRAGWDHWDHRHAPPPAPLPAYQRQYAGPRYPPPDRQAALHEREYRHRPRDEDVRRAWEGHGMHAPPPAAGDGGGHAHGGGHGEGHGGHHGS